MIKKIALVSFFIACCVLFILPAGAGPTIKVDSDREEYKPDDLVTVKVQVSDNSGFSRLLL